uniref:Uncharacterized protein n=1 Tax=Anguilla anguilla TaxID=7936 RepID=A0A0E9PAB9_ANGAN
MANMILSRGTQKAADVPTQPRSPGFGAERMHKNTEVPGISLKLV